MWLEFVSHNGLDIEMYDLSPADLHYYYYYYYMNFTLASTPCFGPRKCCPQTCVPGIDWPAMHHGDSSWRCRCSFTFATDYQTAMFTMIYDGLEAAREAVHLCYKQPVVNTNAYVYWSTYNCRCHIFPLHIFHLDQRLFVFLHGEYTITSSLQRRDYRWNRCNDWLPWQSDCTQWV